jgi:hypothetical protein
MMSTQEQRERITKAAAARAEAVREIMSRHVDEFNEIHSRLRADAGLSPVCAGLTLTPEEVQAVMQARWLRGTPVERTL